MNDDKDKDEDAKVAAQDEDGDETESEETPVPVLVAENHACEPDPQAAIDYVLQFGHPEQGDMDCFADPVNACPDGCCRFANWFICDTDDISPHMPCVCNDLTADPASMLVEPVDPTAPLAPSNATESNTTQTVAAPPSEAPLTLETMEEDFPEILSLLSAQEELAAEEAGVELEDNEDAKQKDRVRRCLKIMSAGSAHANFS